MQHVHHTEIIGLSLPESAIKLQVGLIAKCLAERFHQHAQPLTILVVLNKIGGGAFVRRHVRDALLRIASRSEAEAILGKVHFSETVVNRIVSKIPREILMSR